MESVGSQHRSIASSTCFISQPLRNSRPAHSTPSLRSSRPRLISVKLIAYHHTLAPYTHSITRSLSTAHFIAPYASSVALIGSAYASSVPLIAHSVRRQLARTWLHPLPRFLCSTRELSTARRTRPAHNKKRGTFDRGEAVAGVHG
eukprot:3085811-Rhodomonas_salina.1